MKRRVARGSKPSEGCQSAAICCRFSSRSLVVVLPYLCSAVSCELVLRLASCSWKICKENIREGGIHFEDVCSRFLVAGVGSFECLVLVV